MKTLTVVLVVTVLVIHISGYLIQVPTATIVKPRETAPVQWLHIQKLVIPLFENVCEVSSNPIIRRLSQEFAYNSGDYLKPEVITNLQKLVTAGLLPKGQIFTEYDPEHMKQLKIIYDVLYYAKDFDAFFNAAAWARQNLNCGLYVNAIYMAIQKRRDMEKVSIPAPYELLPNYFVIKDVIVQASSILGGQEITPTEGVRDEGNAYYIDANYTAMFYDNDDDSKLAYFREDIGLNSYYYLRKVRSAPWFNDDINSSYGEDMYQMMKQFMARYNLERYANGLPEIDGIDWNSLPDIPYDPMLIYSDGNEFIHRTIPLELPLNEDLSLLQTIENNIVAVVSHMRQSGYNKTQILNHLMEILVTGDRSYETLARQLLGRDRTNNGHVSVMEHYMTSLRDPMFWKINKNIVDLVDSALKTLPTYSRNELYFPGVEVVNIDVKKMMTAFDYFEFDVTDALKIDDSNSTFNIKIGQPRLNHKSFSIRVNISSLVSKKGLIKIYLGPKMMPGELATKKNLFTLLDMFEINLKIGSNIISRSSDDMKHFAPDFMSLRTIRKKVEDAEYGLDALPQKLIESQIGYPSRLILPKGSAQGLPLQMFVFVAPFTKASLSDSYSTNSMEFNSAILSPGYPLDLMIEDRQLFVLPNAMTKYVTVTQKGDSKVENYGGPGETKQWYGTNSYDPSSRPNYSANREPFDYKSKKGQYDNFASQDIVFDETKEDDATHVLNSSKFDYTSKSKEYEPFDYKSKKAQFDKKDYSTKKEEVIDFKEKNQDDTFIDTPHILPTHEFNEESFEFNTNKAKLEKKEKISNKDNQDSRMMDMPRLLKSSFDTSTNFKRPEGFDYKSKKAQFDKKDYSAKRGDYTKYRTAKPKQDEITTTSTITSSESEDELSRVIINKDTNRLDLFSKMNTDNQDNAMIDMPHLLKSSFDYSTKSKRPETFDYKSKKAQFDKKNYSDKRGDYTKYRTVKPKDEEITITSTITSNESEEKFPRVKLNKDNADLISEIRENIINTGEMENISDDDDVIEVDAFFKKRKRTPTVYDFLFHTLDSEDSPEIKVYE